ncbi:MAG TPA: hypothetical protein VN802_06920 [Stellaceae bacterium]|nr:hypothetical protein [Stellaceae bacterium]
MNSVANPRFWRCFAALPSEIQRRAQLAFRQWQVDPNHSSLDFKRVHMSRPVYSVRIGLRWRALGVREGDTVVWFWIGSHSDYDRLLARM